MKNSVSTNCDICLTHLSSLTIIVVAVKLGKHISGESSVSIPL